MIIATDFTLTIRAETKLIMIFNDGVFTRKGSEQGLILFLLHIINENLINLVTSLIFIMKEECLFTLYKLILFHSLSLMELFYLFLQLFILKILWKGNFGL